MKKFAILLIIFILCACSSDPNKVYEDLNNTFSTYENSTSSNFNNTNTKYCSFYLPSDIQELDYGDTYNHLVFDQSDFIMCLNVNDILANDIFENSGSDPYSFLSNEAIYTYSNDDGTCIFNLYSIDEYLLFSFYTNKMTAFGETNLSNAKELARHLLVLNDSMTIDNDKVIDSFYSGTTIDSTHQAVNLFTTSHATEGYLDDITIK